MEVLVAYDVATQSREGRRRLRKVADICLGYGQRVQYSVFECHVNAAQFEQMLHRLVETINEDEDSLRVYRLREPRSEFLYVYGKQLPVLHDDPLIF